MKFLYRGGFIQPSGFAHPYIKGGFMKPLGHWVALWSPYTEEGFAKLLGTLYTCVHFGSFSYRRGFMKPLLRSLLKPLGAFWNPYGLWGALQSPNEKEASYTHMHIWVFFPRGMAAVQSPLGLWRTLQCPYIGGTLWSLNREGTLWSP